MRVGVCVCACKPFVPPHADGQKGSADLFGIDYDGFGVDYDGFPVLFAVLLP